MFGEESDVLRRRNFQLLLLATVVPSLGTALVSPLLDGLITPFGTPPANIGLMMSIFIAPAIGLVPVLGVLADRYGQKPMLVGSLLLFGMAGAAIVFTTDFRVVLALRYLQGIGFAGINPTIIMSVGNFLQR